MPRISLKEQGILEKAGQQLTKMRESLRLTQTQIMRATQTLGYIIKQQNIAKLELGDVQRPSMRDLVVLGRIYGLTPNQMAHIYGYWEPDESEEELESVLNRLHVLLDREHPNDRMRIIARLLEVRAG